MPYPYPRPQPLNSSNPPFSDIPSDPPNEPQYVNPSNFPSPNPYQTQTQTQHQRPSTLLSPKSYRTQFQSYQYAPPRSPLTDTSFRPIPQPPHSAGRGLSGLRPRIDPNQVPSAVESVESDRIEWGQRSNAGFGDGRGGYGSGGGGGEITEHGKGKTVYNTLIHPEPGKKAPLATTSASGDVVFVDRGNSSPSFIRPTTWSFPSSSKLANDCGIPLGVVVQPFSDADAINAVDDDDNAADESVPVISFDTDSSNAFSGPSTSSSLRPPPRCAHCRAYINPWFTFPSPSTFKCNLCEKESEVPKWYAGYRTQPSSYVNADGFGSNGYNGVGNAETNSERPELSRGTVDFVVGELYEDSNHSSQKGKEPGAAETEYWASPSRPPQALNYVFAFDVSSSQGASGFLYASCLALLNILYGDNPVGGRWNGNKLAIITYDSSLQFWVWDTSSSVSDPNTSSTSPQAKMYIVSGSNSTSNLPSGSTDEDISDLDDPYLPAPADSLFIDPYAHREAVESLLSSLPARFATQPPSHGGGAIPRPTMATAGSALGTAVTASQLLLGNRGGHIVAFLAGMPTVGIGALPVSGSGSKGQSRAAWENEVYGGDKEKLLYRPRLTVWPNLASECASQGVGVTLFLGNEEWVDVGSVGILPTLTGGSLFFHPRFNVARDGPVVESQLRRVLGCSMTTSISMAAFGRDHDSGGGYGYGYDCTAKVRCSKGLKITSLNGSFSLTAPSSEGTMSFGVIDPDKAFSVGLGYTASLRPLTHAYIQVAVLYTSPGGRRMVRVLNLAINVVELAGNVFGAADVEGCVCFLGRKAISSLTTTQPSLIRDDLTENCSAIMLGYRTMCAGASSSRVTQLIIPDTLKALPTYTLALLKSKPLKARNISSDVRNYHINRILTMGIRETIQYLYPRLWAVHDLELPEGNLNSAPDTEVVPSLASRMDELSLSHGTDTNGAASKMDGAQLQFHPQRIPLPPIMRLTHEWMEAGGLYLIDNEESMILWIGSMISRELLKRVFGDGVDEVGMVDGGITSLPLPSSLSPSHLKSHPLLSHLHSLIHTSTLLRGGRKAKFFIARQNMDAAEIEFSDMLVEDENCGTVGYLDYLTIIHKQISTVLTEGGSIGGSRGMRSPW